MKKIILIMGLVLYFIFSSSLISALDCEKIKDPNYVASAKTAETTFKDAKSVKTVMDCFGNDIEARRTFLENNIESIPDLRRVDNSILNDYFANPNGVDCDIDLSLAYVTGKGGYTGGKITFDRETNQLKGPWGIVNTDSFPASGGYKVTLSSKDGKNIRITFPNMGENEYTELAQSGSSEISLVDGVINIDCGGECNAIELLCTSNNPEIPCNYKVVSGSTTYNVQIPGCEKCTEPPLVGIIDKKVSSCKKLKKGQEKMTCYDIVANVKTSTTDTLINGKVRSFDPLKFSMILEDGYTCELNQNTCFEGKTTINIPGGEEGFSKIETKPSLSISGPGQLFQQRACADCKDMDIFNPKCLCGNKRILWEGSGARPSLKIEGGDIYTGTWKAKGLFKMHRYDNQGNYIAGGDSVTYSKNIKNPRNIEMEIGPPTGNPQTANVIVRGNEREGTQFMNIFMGKCLISTMSQNLPPNTFPSKADCGHEDNGHVTLATATSDSDNSVRLDNFLSGTNGFINIPYALNVETYGKGNTAGEKIDFEEGKDEEGKNDGTAWYRKYKGDECKAGECDRVQVRAVNHMDTPGGRANMMYCDMMYDACSRKNIFAGQGKKQDWYDACRDWASNMILKKRLDGEKSCGDLIDIDSTVYSDANAIRRIKPPVCQAAVRMIREQACNRDAWGTDLTGALVAAIPKGDDVGKCFAQLTWTGYGCSIRPLPKIS